MSKKAELLLDLLLDHFENDAEAVEAIQLIQNKLVDVPITKIAGPPRSKVSATIDQFPIPKTGLSEQNIFLYTDGACRGNPGPGAWGAMAQNNNGDLIFEAAQISERTTNNIMELTAVLEGLRKIQSDYASYNELCIHVYSDSKYVVEGMKTWVYGWKKRGWKKADKKTPENVEVWQGLDAIREVFKEVHFNWIKGHSGHPQNDRVDELANIALDGAGF